MGRRRRTTTPVLAALSAVVLSGCGSAVWPTATAQERFVKHFTETYPGRVVDTITEVSAMYPFSPGEMSGLVVVADDTSPADFETILTDVLGWDPGNSTRYVARGVQANGLGVCGDDEQRAAKQELRDALHTQGLALAGTWPCTTWERAEGPTYRATVADFTADTAMVGDLLAGSDLVLRAQLRDPSGRIEAPWAQVPTHLEEVLHAVRGVLPISQFEFTAEHGLRVAVHATDDLAAVQDAAQRAAGPDLTVEVAQGDLDAGRAAEIAPLGPVADAIRAVPGVLEVRVQHGQVVIVVDDVDAVVPAVDTGATHPELGSAGLELRITTADSGNPPQHRYYWRAGAPREALPAFVDLLQQDVVEMVRLSESRTEGPPSLRLDLGAPIVEGLPQVKASIPVGVAVTAKGNDGLATVEFVSAPDLTADDLSTRFTTQDLDRIASAWNAAGSAMFGE